MSRVSGPDHHETTPLKATPTRSEEKGDNNKNTYVQSYCQVIKSFKAMKKWWKIDGKWLLDDRLVARRVDWRGWTRKKEKGQNRRARGLNRFRQARGWFPESRWLRGDWEGDTKDHECWLAGGRQEKGRSEAQLFITCFFVACLAGRNTAVAFRAGHVIPDRMPIPLHFPLSILPSLYCLIFNTVFILTIILFLYYIPLYKHS